MKQMQTVVTYVTILLVVASLTAAEPKSKSKGKQFDRIIKVNGKDLTRKSIVFDKDTPDVFYCIPSKPTGEDKIIVRWVNTNIGDNDMHARSMKYLLIFFSSRWWIFWVVVNVFFKWKRQVKYVSFIYVCGKNEENLHLNNLRGLKRVVNTVHIVNIKCAWNFFNHSHQLELIECYTIWAFFD